MMLDDFYPTPNTLIRKMLAGLDLRGVVNVLEPSAGKGDICDHMGDEGISQYGRSITRRFDVIEINPELQHILRGKGYNLIDADFLQFETFQSYDLIIANFPFSQGDEHLQKALALLEQNGGQMVCLVNAETIRNPYTHIRRAVVNKLEGHGAEIEFLAGEFASAERRTDVGVALIRVKVERAEKFSFILSELQEAQAVKARESHNDQLVDRDVVGALIARYRMEASAGVRLIEEYQALAPHIQNNLPRKGDESERYSSPLIELKVKDSSARDSAQAKINSYLPLLRRKYWDLLINDRRFTGQCTSNIVRELNNHLEVLTSSEFNRFNIEQLSEDLNRKVNRGVEEAILSLFDELSRKFAWDESIHQKNVHYYNGWKTNKAWKINRKVILPINGIDAGWGKPRFRYEIDSKLADMVKVFNYLSPEKSNVLQLVGNSMRMAEHMGSFDCDLRYFSIKFYKKGTAHITFLDQELLDKFNIFGSQRKGWLPPGYGKKFYEEMNQDERASVDDFQGREAYEKVMQDPERYIVSDARALLGGDEQTNAN